MDLLEEAETCRQRALSYLGQPESKFLLHAAREFERLAREKASHDLARRSFTNDGR